MYSKQNGEEGLIFNRVKRKHSPVQSPISYFVARGRRFAPYPNTLRYRAGGAGITPIQSLRSLRGKPA